MIEIPPNADTVSRARIKHTDALLAMRENSAGSEAPADPAQGQLWFDTGAGFMRYWDGTTWKAIASAGSQIIVSSSAYQFTAAQVSYNGGPIIPLFVAKVKMNVARADLSPSVPTVGALINNWWSASLINISTGLPLSTNPWNSFNDGELAFGVAQDLNLDQNLVVEAGEVLSLQIQSAGSGNNLSAQIWNTTLVWSAA